MSMLQDYAVVQELCKDRDRRLAHQQLAHQGKHQSKYGGLFQPLLGWVGRHFVSWGNQLQARSERLEHSR